jgi:hypothetical protein
MIFEARRLHLQALLAALKPVGDRHGHMRLAWITTLLLVALDEGKGVAHYAREANLHRAHMSRNLHYLGDKRNLHDKSGRKGYTNPSWVPPLEVRRDKPNLPPIIPGGSPRNPMGVAAMTLSGGEYAIHGTNQPSSIGHFVSYGCIRMFNEDIQDLYQRVSVGTQVIVQ